MGMTDLWRHMSGHGPPGDDKERNNNNNNSVDYLTKPYPPGRTKAVRTSLSLLYPNILEASTRTSVSTTGKC